MVHVNNVHLKYLINERRHLVYCRFYEINENGVTHESNILLYKCKCYGKTNILLL